jgi:ActR/RegA family two-component response regulator
MNAAAVTNSHLTFGINALILCDDTHFLKSLERVFAKLGVNSERSADYAAALAALDQRKIDAIVVDWREIADLGEFLETVRKSRMNKECLIIGIAGDLLDLRQAFSAGVQFLIHKPASVVQIVRCLQAAHAAIIVKRRKQHREPVRIAATLHTRSVPLMSGTIVNLSSQGAGLKLDLPDEHSSERLSAGDEIDLSFISPGSWRAVTVSGVLIWKNNQGEAGVRFEWTAEKAKLEQWVGERFDNAVAMSRGQTA